TVINTNIGATIARNAIGTNERAMATSMERLSTGLRINSAKDDAAGLAIATRMTAQVSTLNMGVRNANDAISMIQTVEGASKEITNMLVRMKELAVQSRSDTYSLADRDALDLEFQALKTEITRVQANTEWNGMKLMDSDKGTLKIQLGDSTMDVVTKDWSFADASQADHVFQSATNAATFAITDDASSDRSQTDAATNAGNAITLIDTMINEATKEQATLGAYISRLTHAADNLANVSANTDQSRSRIQDADYAVETTNLARTQIIAQASTAMLAQANQSKQSVLALLR
ncbi:flagellin, partial [Gammaproteobacteria bacterium]|nr:flagellin [Gammaproteobacteria bacterium]